MRYTLFLLLCAYTLTAHGQQAGGILRGTIRGAEGQPLENITVYLKPGTKAQQTNQEGDFQFTAPSGRYQLLTSHLNFDSFQDSIQLSDGKELTLAPIVLKEAVRGLDEFVTTGSLSPQSLKQTVYQVRVITREQMQLRAATSIQGILNTELGIQLSNDLTLGTTDIQLLGMSGQNVKILLDGMPMTDRGAVKESLGQIDINSIERIEIVEGPMSVMYGTDALAGVINLITKTNTEAQSLSVQARLQEETVHEEYQPLGQQGVHNAHVGLHYNYKSWRVSGSLSRNHFGGWQGDYPGRAKQWMPKTQLLGSAGLGISRKKWEAWYRLSATDEDLQSLGNINANNQIASDKNYLTQRWYHQLQGKFKPSDRLTFSLDAAYTDYSRKTLSTNLDLETGRRTLSTEVGAQDESTFTTAFSRATMSYRITDNLNIIGGMDYTSNQSHGPRIAVDAPVLNEYAVFISPEIKLASKLNIRPGLRLLKNSQYQAPPAIPSLNAKLKIGNHLDLRGGYARGFRSPDLRELYFWFFDASHSIKGNPDLRAENSNSFNGSLTARWTHHQAISLTSSLGGFYNTFNDLITTAVSASDPAITTYINVARYKTLGGNWNNKLYTKNLLASFGVQLIGRYNQYQRESSLLGESKTYTWTPEVNSTVSYRFLKSGTTVGLVYKFTGRQPIYLLDALGELELTRRSSYSMADLSIQQKLGRYLTLQSGIRNLFNLTNITSGATDTSGAHSTGSSLPLSYGRSYFLGLTFQWAKNENKN
ncbi:outer membrane receptor for ferrienterochelin and colicins [Dyadobacter jejuensis]|uniref:Outer membrane receptor for ferrienterochelin and colicins n=1 Tax=Dyadobacter jejuensis TaxID=1082580 RepID=A0A316AFY6_9BACT|nr:TonB-dependent receptor [Dyadobacter jejuensis]PWJ56696.1 outer membrane receptor for ferrienterochelin and colicins [Dyadobacter jejuensis]